MTSATGALSDAARRLRNPRWYCENLLKIVDKRQELVHLRFKPAQIQLYRILREEREKGRGVRLVVLKGRQLGASTMIEALFFSDSATHFNASTLICLAYSRICFSWSNAC